MRHREGHRMSAARAARTPANPSLLLSGIRWAAVLLPAGPAAVAVLRFVLPYSTLDSPAEIVAGVAAGPGAQSAVLWLGMAASLLLAPSVWVVGMLAIRQAPRLAALALALAVPGYMALPLLLAQDALLWTGVNQGLPHSAVAQMTAGMHPSIAAAEALFVLGHVLGTVLLGLALWRSRAVQGWAALAVSASQPLHLLAAVFLVSPALDLVAWLFMAAGFAAAARKMVQSGA